MLRGSLRSQQRVEGADVEADAAAAHVLGAQLEFKFGAVRG